MNNEEPQMFGQNPSENKNHELYQKLQKKPEISQATPTQNSLQTPESILKIDAQWTEEIINTKSKKDNLRGRGRFCVTNWSSGGLVGDLFTLVSAGSNF